MVLEVLAEVQNFQRTAAAALTMSDPAEAVVQGRRVGEFLVIQAATLDLRMLA